MWEGPRCPCSHISAASSCSFCYHLIIDLSTRISDNSPDERSQVHNFTKILYIRPRDLTHQQSSPKYWPALTFVESRQ